jgi:hypothetical protein
VSGYWRHIPDNRETVEIKRDTVKHRTFAVCTFRFDGDEDRLDDVLTHVSLDAVEFLRDSAKANLLCESLTKQYKKRLPELSVGDKLFRVVEIDRPLIDCVDKHLVLLIQSEWRSYPSEWQVYLQDEIIGVVLAADLAAARYVQFLWAKQFPSSLSGMGDDDDGDLGPLRVIVAPRGLGQLHITDVLTHRSLEVWKTEQAEQAVTVDSPVENE